MEDRKGSNLLLKTDILQHLQHWQQDDRVQTCQTKQSSKYIFSVLLPQICLTRCHFQSKSELVLGIIIGHLFTHQLFLSETCALFSPTWVRALFSDTLPVAGQRSWPWNCNSSHEVSTDRGWSLWEGLAFSECKTYNWDYELCRKRSSLV